MNDELVALGSVKTRGMLLLLVVAVAGGAVGAAIDRAWMIRNIRGEVEGLVRTGQLADTRTEGRRLEEIGREAARRANGEGEGIPLSLRSIDLTDGQKERIREITARYRPVAESLMRSVRPRVIELDLRMRQEAMCVLTPKQRDDWIAWRKRERLSVEEGGELLKVVTSGQCPMSAGAAK